MPDDAKQLLREHGLHVTAQRIAVLGAVDAHPHATADRIAAVVEERIGSVSRQAIYDALTALSDRGVIRRIQPARSAALYETRTGDNHHHAVCRVCRTTVDVDCAAGQRPCLQASPDHGFLIDEAEVIYWGLCPACQATHTDDDQGNRS